MPQALHQVGDDLVFSFETCSFDPGCGTFGGASRSIALDSARVSLESGEFNQFINCLQTDLYLS